MQVIDKLKIIAVSVGVFLFWYYGLALHEQIWFMMHPHLYNPVTEPIHEKIRLCIGIIFSVLFGSVLWLLKERRRVMNGDFT